MECARTLYTAGVDLRLSVWQAMVAGLGVHSHWQQPEVMILWVKISQTVASSHDGFDSKNTSSLKVESYVLFGGNF